MNEEFIILLCVSVVTGFLAVSTSGCTTAVAHNSRGSHEAIHHQSGSLGDLSQIAECAQGFEEVVSAGYAKGYREGHQAGYEQASAAADHRDYSQGQTYLLLDL